MTDSEVFVNDEDTHELVEVKKKGRKPMSEERKEQLREQLRKAREAKKAKKAKGEKVEKEPKVKEVLPATESEPAILVKNVRKTKPAKDHTNEIAELKSQIAELKANKTSKEDLEEIKLLKLEMKEIRAAALEYKKQQKAKEAAQKAKEAEQKAKEVITPDGEAKEQRITTKHKKNEPKKVTMSIEPKIIDDEKPKPRYSTYKKSVWSQFT